MQGGFRHRRVSCGLGLFQKPRLWKDQDPWICRVLLRLQLRSAWYGHRLVCSRNSFLWRAKSTQNAGVCMLQLRVALFHNKEKIQAFKRQSISPPSLDLRRMTTGRHGPGARTARPRRQPRLLAPFLAQQPPSKRNQILTAGLPTILPSQFPNSNFQTSST